jgi:hypothetical protein
MPNDLQEALTAAGASALIQKQIDPVLLEYMRRYAPVVRAIPTQKWGSNVYFFNRRDSLPAGGFVTDGGARPVTTSVYEQASFTIRNFQTVGAVTGYAEAVTADLAGSLRAKEISGAHQGLLWDIETAILWGNSQSTVNGPYPQFDGLDTIASTFSGNSQNAVNFTDNAFDLGTLDTIIDLVEQNVAMPVESTDWMFVCSPTVNSRIAQLLTNQQRFMQVEVAPGLVVASYRNVPIVKSSFLQPRSNVMGTVTSSTGGSGSSFAGGQEYFYRVAAVMNRFGEIQASVECNATPSAGANVTLSFTPPVGPENASPNLYKVFRSTTTSTETLLGYVDANVAIAADGVTPIVTNQIVDTGNNLIPQNSTGPTQPATLSATAYTGTNSGVLPLSAGDQSIYLLSRDSDFIVRPYVRDLQPVDIYPTTASPDSLPFAIVSDTTFAVRAPKYLGRCANVNVTLAS